MTNKEAIDYIKLIFVRDRANELHFILHDEEIALDMAIKALEEQPTVKCDWGVDDLISRKELLRLIPSEEIVARMAIMNAPTVEPRIEYGTDGQPYRLFISGGRE